MGTSGSALLRDSPVTATMRSLPARWCSIVSTAVSTISGIWPPSRSLTAGASVFMYPSLYEGFGLPESPRWLIGRRGDRAAGLAVLRLVEPELPLARLEAHADEILAAADGVMRLAEAPAMGAPVIPAPMATATMSRPCVSSAGR